MNGGRVMSEQRQTWNPASRNAPVYLCQRCHQEKPRGQLLATATGATYCIDCLPNVQMCRICGCTDEAGCPGGCWWAERSLCSMCASPLPDSPVVERFPPALFELPPDTRLGHGGS